MGVFDFLQIYVFYRCKKEKKGKKLGFLEN